ncbi:MAG TPA: SusD/RagB family nutrient-binding outer membrane lipoprotein, partial [Puia sp.]|nr:SusD/RagB family nutrient-binding outer membrane lipoprotein [Puia sp.]
MTTKMNNYKKIFCGSVLGGLLLFAACTKKLNTNSTDPNGLGINAVTGKDVFAQALNATVTNKTGTCISAFPGDNYDYAQEWMGYWSRNSGYSASGVGAHVEAYAMIYSDANGVWQSLYHNIYDYNYVMANSSKGSILPGASRVVRAMIFEDLVDQFGNIPYLQAAQPNVSITPAYDSAATIYKGLVAQIDSAIAEITASQSTADDASDILFKGSKSLWLAFANTLKLRMLLRQVPNVYSATDPYITGELANVASQGGFLGAGQDAVINPGYIDASEQQNPFWGDYGYEP